MDYEKKYNEALEIARQIHNGNPSSGTAIVVCEQIFPELRESEDERMRKRAIAILKQQRDYYSYDGPIDKFPPATPRKALVDAIDVALSYLEKQKEQPISAEEILARAGLKPYKDGNQWCILAGDNIQEGICGFGDTIEDALYEFLKEVMNLQKEQNPAELSEDYRDEDIQTRFAFYTYKDDPSVLYLSNVFVEETSRNHGFGTRILKAAEKAAEAMGAITICLKVKQDSPANAWYRKRGYGYVAYEDGYDWLEKNLEYLKPAKSAEWSEEDEKMKNDILDLLDSNIAASDYHEIEDWLNALPNRISLRPSWKPSDEQMTALRDVITMKRTGNEFAETKLREIYEQLQKQ